MRLKKAVMFHPSLRDRERGESDEGNWETKICQEYRERNDFSVVSVN